MACAIIRGEIAVAQPMLIFWTRLYHTCAHSERTHLHPNFPSGSASYSGTQNVGSVSIDIIGNDTLATCITSLALTAGAPKILKKEVKSGTKRQKLGAPDRECDAFILARDSCKTAIRCVF